MLVAEVLQRLSFKIWALELMLDATEPQRERERERDTKSLFCQPVSHCRDL